MRTPVILYSDFDDPIALAMHADSNVERIHVDELLPFFSRSADLVFPAFSPPLAICEKFSGKTTINRIFDFENTKVLALMAAWGYHEMWLHFHLSRLLSLGSRLIHDTGPKGVSRSLLPLNSQWALIENTGYPVSTPEFVFNFGGELIGLEALHEPIQKSVWSLFDWRQENHLSEREANWHRFFVERPRGIPVLCYFFDPEHLDEEGLAVIPLRDGFIGPDIPFLELAKLLARTFASVIGEFLVYIEDNGDIKFHAFSPHMRTAANQEGFPTIVERWTASLLRSGSAHRLGL